MKFSCQDKLLPGNDYTEKYLNAVEAGFDSIEVNVSEKLPLSEMFKDILAASSASTIKPSTVCGGYRGWIGDFEKDMRNMAIEDIKNMFPIMEKIGATGIVVPAAYGMFSKKLPPFIPPRTDIEDRKILLESLEILGNFGTKHGIRVFLEPLNRYEDHMVNRVEQAVEIVRELGNPGVTTMIDLFHANIEETTISTTIQNFGEYIGHVHLADSNRYQPGMGHMDYKQILGSLNSTGFNGFCALECNILGNGLDPMTNIITFLKSNF